MWWSRRGLILSALAAGGCGFRPLYGEGSPAAALLGRIAVGSITRGTLPDRMGFHLRDALVRRLGVARDAGWRLDLRLGIEEAGLAITPDNATTRFSLTAVAAWDLIPAGSAAPVLSGEAESFSAYSATATVYATRIAARDAERRLAEDLAQRIVVQIAARADALAP
jgi:LPS-assembly lipoprotein